MSPRYLKLSTIQSLNKHDKDNLSIGERKERQGGAGSKGRYKEYEMSHRTELEHVLQRLVLMSYFPSGFWSRLLTRVLADDSVVEIVR